MSQLKATGFWLTVRLLLKNARLRSTGRSKRQREILRTRQGGSGSGIDWGRLGLVAFALFMAVVHGIAAFAIVNGVKAGQRNDAERAGKIVVFSGLINIVQSTDTSQGIAYRQSSENWDESIRNQADAIARRSGGNKQQIAARLKREIDQNGTRNLISEEIATPGLHALGNGLGALLGSLVLLVWMGMLVCQGEGLELDLQRRRHPMWEWLFSHPVEPAAVFLAEMLAPLAANPIYWSAPLTVGILYFQVYDLASGLLAALLIGLPLTISLACVGKALEVSALLRLAPRSRGAAIGIMSWFGYASMMGLLFSMAFLGKIPALLGPTAHFFAVLPFPLLGLILGHAAEGFSFVRGLAFCWALIALLTGAAVWSSARATRQGLTGNFANAPVKRNRTRQGFGADPLFRKETLWFLRDRSAIVQTILVPITVASVQLFNMRGLLQQAGSSWNYVCGAAIFFGTYFLWILGPKSLLSEGSALWIALTWPRGLEDLLKAKAWLWSMISSALVASVLLCSCFFFPHDLWKIALVGLGWYVFARSMAEKSVTLVTLVSESGEAQKVPTGRRWAAQLGMLTFAIGVCTQQWNLAIVGIVYSWMTALAMWENFRARLPFLYDPWSERLPQPPTLMHSMIAISALVEGSSVLMVAGLALCHVSGLNGPAAQAFARTLSYAASAVTVAICYTNFLSNRGVTADRIWRWSSKLALTDEEAEARAHWSYGLSITAEETTQCKKEAWIATYIAGNWREAGWLLLGASAGLLLAQLAHLYLYLLGLVPALRASLEKSQQMLHASSATHTAMLLLAVGVAPFAEEYLFRGLLFRTLDRHWGDWRAVVASSAFFAIYHPVVAWPMVLLLGAANCLLFKRSRRLAPAIVLHMLYNLLVL